MINSKALKGAFIFFVTYSIGLFAFAPLLVSWGSKSIIRDFFNFLMSFPLDWKELVVDHSIWFLLIHSFFWSIVVYGLIIGCQKLYRLIVR